MICSQCGKQDCAHIKKSMVKKAISKDGKGGPGDPLVSANPLAPVNPLQGGASAQIPGANPGLSTPAAMTPSMGTAITPSTFTPQQQMQMSAQGMQPIGSGLPAPTVPAHAQKIANRPHGLQKGPTMHKAKKLKGLKSLISKARKPVF
jgi:hypothetical protein